MREIPEETIGRLFCYLRQLLCLQREGRTTVSSQVLADACGVKSSMVRKDFSYFGELGVRGVGYKVDDLIAEFRSILKLDKGVKAALVGVGNIGRALLKYPGFEPEGFQIVRAFDADARKVGQHIDGVCVESAERMEERIRADGIKLAIVAVPVSEAPAVAARLTTAGVKAILSFAPCPLKMPDDVKVSCVDLATEMAKLVYYL
ncbi:MAG: redox-sensing transcriptional repressor Rex [Planctomycetota bacterium]